MSSSLDKFVPQFSYITAISLGQTTTLTFLAAHDFIVGEIISLRVSKPYGTVELNNIQSTVLSITPTTVTIPIESSNFTPFINAGLFEPNPAMAVPSSSGIDPTSIPIQTTLQDAFDHILLT